MATANLCEQCHLKPKFQSFRYCGRTCGQLASTGSLEKCDYCHIRPKRWEGTRKHDYCGKTCADKAKTHPPAPSNVTSAVRPPLTNKNTSTTGACEHAGCSTIVTGGAKYCTQHYQQALQDAPCLLCRSAPKMPKSAFCGSPQCEQTLSRSAPCLIEVPANHPSFLSVEKQFQTSWKHGSHCPRVRKIFKIILECDSLKRYDAYKADVEARGKFSQDSQRKMTEGNERRRWHGTRKDCHLGDPGHHQGTAFCSNSTCSLCKIIQDSFNLDQWGKNTGWGRFGKGIYTSATSSKANDYIRNNAASDYNAILLNNVVIGRGKKLTHDNTNLQAAPASFDSVLGEKGGSLNHDEVVVYKGEAIRPSYMVVFDAV